MTDYDSQQGNGEAGQLFDSQQTAGYQSAQYFDGQQSYGYQQPQQDAGQAYGYQQPQPFSQGGDQAYGYQQYQQVQQGAGQVNGYQQYQQSQPGGGQQPYGYQQQYDYQQTQQYDYQQAQYGAPQAPYQQPTYWQAAPEPDNSTTYIVLSVLEFLFCGGLLAIIPFVFSLQYRSEYQSGHYDEALSKKKSAKKSLIIVLIVGLVLTIALIAATIGLGVLAYEADQSGTITEQIEEIATGTGTDAGESALSASAGAAVGGSVGGSIADSSPEAQPTSSNEYYTITLPDSLEYDDIGYEEGTLEGKTAVGAITSVLKDDHEEFVVACFSNDWGVQGDYAYVTLGSPSAAPNTVVYVCVPVRSDGGTGSTAMQEAQQKADEYATYVTVI